MIKKIPSKNVLVYDPIVKRKANFGFSQVDDSKKLILDSDIIILMTDWKNLKKLRKNFKNINLGKKVIIDPHGLLRSNFENKCKKYFTLGRKNEI